MNARLMKTSHGPQVWPWWKLFTVRAVLASHDPARYFWITPIAYNIWIYTRWGAKCLTYKERRGVYRRSEFGQLDGGDYDPFEDRLERAAADLWRAENPHKSVFATTHEEQEAYRRRVSRRCAHGKLFTESCKECGYVHPSER